MGHQTQPTFWLVLEDCENLLFGDFDDFPVVAFDDHHLAFVGLRSLRNEYPLAAVPLRQHNTVGNIFGHFHLISSELVESVAAVLHSAIAAETNMIANTVSCRATTAEVFAKT